MKGMGVVITIFRHFCLLRCFYRFFFIVYYNRSRYFRAQFPFQVLVQDSMSTIEL